MSKMSGEQSPKRGDVFWVNFDPQMGTEVKKRRPAVILSNNLFNKHLPRLIVVPLTSNMKKIFEFDTLVQVNGKSGKAMLDQMRTIDKSRLGQKICTITPQELLDIEQAIKIALAIN